MAIKFMEGFDYQEDVAAVLSGGWTSSSGSALSLDDSRFDTGHCLVLGPPSPQNNFYNTNIGTFSRIIMGMAFKTESFTNGDPSIFYLHLLSSGHLEFSLAYATNGGIVAYRGTSADSGVLLGSSDPSILELDTWAYIELDIVIAVSTGSVVVRVDGVEIINLTGITSTYSGQTTLDTMLLFGSNSGASSKYYDDIYIADDSGSLNNDFIGPCRIKTLLPEADGNLTEWDVNTGNSWDAVATNDGDTTYISDTSSGLEHQFDLPDIETSDTPLAVEVVGVAKCATSTPKRIWLTLMTSEGYAENINDQMLTLSYAYYRDLWNVQPHNGLAWTPSRVNSSQIGVHMTLGFGGIPFNSQLVSCTQLVAQVLLGNVASSYGGHSYSQVVGG